MTVHLELAKMVCMGWKPQGVAYAADLLKRHLQGTPSLNSSERFLIEEALWALSSSVSPVSSVVTESIEATVKKRRGCPPGGWPKKVAQVEHD